MSKTNQNDTERGDVLALVDKYIKNVKSDKAELVEGLRQSIESPERSKSNVWRLIERFGKMPRAVFLNVTKRYGPYLGATENSTCFPVKI